jgi:prepilin-type N-terminal cleavage/methylation domain-containing protein/prepilin-type processing-associated H-X9-DG protein
MFRFNDFQERLMRVQVRRTSGFTLIELLVVIAIIAILVSLLLPAVQQAREAARRTQCKNNLKQMALAIHNYVDVYNRMPMGSVSAMSGAFDDDGFGWQTSILPYIEQKNLYDKLSQTTIAGQNLFGRFGALELYWQLSGSPATGAPIPGGETIISGYRCPSSTLPPVVPANFVVPGSTAGFIPAGNLWAIGYALTDYKGCGGSPYGDFGVLHKNREKPGGCKFADITDGLSNTLMIAESSYITGNGNDPTLSNPNPIRVEDWPTWLGPAGDDEMMRVNGRTNSPINCRCTPNTMQRAINDDCAFSFHTGGAQFAMCDGSVHFLSENISMETYGYLHDRQDGQPVGQW